MIRSVQKRRPRASVVVLTCGSAEVTLNCLESVVAGRYPNLQVVVVCNGTDPSLAEAVQCLKERAGRRNVTVHVLVNPINVGACAGRNQAMQVVEGKYVAFIDNDVMCHDAWWLNRAVDLLRLRPKVGVVGPRLVCITRPVRLECAGYAVDPAGRVIALGAGRPLDDPRFQRVRVVQAVGNFVSRSEIVRAVGGFDPAFDPFGFENIDCCYRIKAAGYDVVCDGRSDLYHLGHVTTGGFEQQGQRMLFDKSLLLRRRWRTVFQREGSLFESLMAGEVPAGEEVA
jgi:GT2 family glycosyltransferase